MILFLLSNLAFAQNQNPVQPKVEMGVWHAITSASPVVQLTLILLIVMSVVTWAIILNKKNQFKGFFSQNEDFLDQFWKAGSLDEIYDSLDKVPESAMGNIFKSGYLELTKIADSKLAVKKDNDTVFIGGLDNLERSLKKATEVEIAKLEQRLSFLASTGSSAPFIGLFGTVWGIMNAFQKIALAGSASLAVVAPGIAEALVATAIGLLAAIPAAIGYNYYMDVIRKLEVEMHNFNLDFLNIAKRNFFKG